MVLPVISRRHSSTAIAAILLSALYCGHSPTASASTPAAYYDTISTASAAALRDSLNNIVTAGSKEIGYNNTWPAMEYCDADPANPANVILMYGRASRAINEEHDQDGNPTTGGWSREHAFPQSFFREDEPPRSDIHALFPCDADINNYRSNYPYNIVPNPSFVDPYDNRVTTQTSVDVFEPADVDKGRIARAILYMDIRYEGKNGDWNLFVSDNYPGGTGDGEMGYLTPLLAWHRQFPPDAFERARNHKAYRFQKNANPFVDHPEWVPMIYGGTPWTFANGDSPTVTGTNRLAPNLLANLIDAPVLQLDLILAANEYHVGSLTVSTSGTATSADIQTLRLWYDVNGDGQASPTDDTLLSQHPNSDAGVTTITLPRPFYLAKGNTKLLITANVSAAAVEGRTFQMSIEAPGIMPHASGGTDIPPVFSTIQSGPTVIGNSHGPLGELIISEVLEGNGGNFKYVEIQNPTSSAVNLEGTKLRIYRNVNTTFFDIGLIGTIPPNDYFVIANNPADFTEVYSFAADQYNSNVDHNGNDKYELRLADGTLVDTFAADRIGDTADFSANRVAIRHAAALPNSGAWGTTLNPADGTLTSNGFWFVRTISSDNANADIVGTPGSPNPVFNRVELNLEEFGLQP